MASVFYFTRKIIGPDPELGRMLMKAFWSKLAETDVKGDKAVLAGDAVDMVCKGSEHLEVVKNLQTKGLDILICPICVDFYKEKDAIAAGRLAGMPEIIKVLRGGAGAITVS